MRVPRPTSHPAFREALRVSRARPGIAAGLRAGLLTTAPLLLAPLLGRSSVAFMGLAGFGTTLVDKGGSYRARLLAMTSFGAAGALGVLSATELAPHPALALPFLFVVLLAAGYVRVLGAEAAAVGVFVGVDVIISLSRPLPSALASAEAAGFFLLGNLWAQALALWVWPLRPYRPARLALARALEALASVAAALGSVSLDAEAQRSRRSLLAASRTAIEAARAALDSSRRGRSGPTRRGARLLLAVENADVLFGALIALEDELTRGLDPGLAAPAARLSGALAVELRQLAASVVAEQPAPPEPAAPEPSDAPAAAPLAAVQTALSELTAELAALDDPDPAPAARIAARFGEERPAVASLLRDSLTLRSAYLRHALRVAVAAVLAHGLSAALQLSHGYWATVTCFVIMQPQGTATTAKALQRVLGTLLGAGLAVLVASSVASLWALAVAVFVFVAAGVALLPINYGAYAVFLTPGFVLLAEHAAGDAGLARVRVLNTLLGAGVALLCARTLLPFSERDQFRPLMVEALGKIAGLARLVTTGSRDAAALHRERRRAGLALLNAEASHQRLLSEAVLAPEESEALSTMLLYAHRVTALLTVLGASGEAERDAGVAITRVASELDALAERVRGRTRHSAPDGLLEGSRPAPGEAADRISHLCAQLDVLVRAAARFERVQSAPRAPG
jgi:uncharacterized membrane protein YccC